MNAHVRSAGLFVVLVVVTATHAFAGQNWELEAHGGVTTSTGGSDASPSTSHERDDTNDHQCSRAQAHHDQHHDLRSIWDGLVAVPYIHWSA
jgi:hypothetical protein